MTERGRQLKARIVRLDVDFESGLLSPEEYGQKQAEIMEEIRRLSSPRAQGVAEQ